MLALSGVVVALGAFGARDDGATTSREPEALPAVGAALDLFNEYPLVAIAESHGLSEQEAFVRRLVENPRFAEEVGTLVLESGNARFQRLVDRYVTGAHVPADELAAVWRDHFGSLGMTVGPAELLRAVRRVNAALPAARRIRVLLADPPIRWSTIETRADLERFARRWDRERFYASLVMSGVLARGRKALLVAGGFHFGRINPPGAWTAGSLLEERRPGSLFVVQPHVEAELDGTLAGWPNPSFARVRGTALGSRTLRLPWRSEPVRAEEVYDGYLYLGPVAELSLTTASPLVWRDDALFREFLRRRRLAFGPAFRPEQMIPPIDARYPVQLDETVIPAPPKDGGRPENPPPGSPPDADVLEPS